METYNKKVSCAVALELAQERNHSTCFLIDSPVLELPDEMVLPGATLVEPKSKIE